MSDPFHIMTKPQLKALIQRMEQTEQKALETGNLELAFKVQQRIVDLAFQLHPEWKRGKEPVAPSLPPKSNGKAGRVRVQPEPEREPAEPGSEELAALRNLSDEELERSIGR